MIPGSPASNETLKTSSSAQVCHPSCPGFVAVATTSKLSAFYAPECVNRHVLGL